MLCSLQETETSTLIFSPFFMLPQAYTKPLFSPAVSSSTKTNIYDLYTKEITQNIELPQTENSKYTLFCH